MAVTVYGAGFGGPVMMSPVRGRVSLTQRTTPGTPPPPAERARMEPRGAALQDAQAFIASLDEIDL